MLVPNVPFADGDPFTPELAYMAFNSPVFDGQTQYLGHRGRIEDTELSDAAGALKSRVFAITTPLKVSSVSGLTLAYTTGVAQLANGSLLTIPASQLTAPDNSISYVYINSNGVVEIANQLPVIRYQLAVVVAASGSVTQITDMRDLAIRTIAPAPSSVKSFGGNSTSDKVATANEIYDQGLYYFRDFTVPAGVSIVVDKFARIFCSGNVVIDGTVNVASASSGAVGWATFGTGNAYLGGTTGSGAGSGSGSSATRGGNYYSYAAQPFGSGGGLGYMSGASTDLIVFGDAGEGGGGFWIEAAGKLTVTGSIFAKGTNASPTIVNGGSPTVSGSGGGSGGLIYLSSLVSVTVSPTAVLDVTGGSGSAGVGAGQGGSGGGGGWIVCASPSNNTSGAALNYTGGNKGSSPGAANIGGGGGGGFGGAGGHQSAGSPGRFVLRNFIPIG